MPVLTNALAPDNQEPRVGGSGVFGSRGSPAASAGSAWEASPSRVFRSACNPVRRRKKPETVASPTSFAATVVEDTCHVEGSSSDPLVLYASSNPLPPSSAPDDRFAFESAEKVGDYA